MNEYEAQKSKDEKMGVIEADEASLEQLKALGFNEIGSRKALIATKNASIDAAYEYYLNHESDPNFTKDSVEETQRKKRKKPRYIPLELQYLFTKLDALDERDITTEGENC